MKLGFRFKQLKDGDVDVAVFDIETGQVVEMVTAVQITMNAGDMSPKMTLTCFASQVDVDGAGVPEGDYPVFPSRQRSIDIDGPEQ